MMTFNFKRNRLIFLQFLLSFTTVLEGLENGLVDSFVEISYKQCTAECDSNSMCTLATYSARFTLCKLYKPSAEYGNQQSEAGIKVYEKKTTTTSCDRNDEGSSCKVKTCPSPPLIPDTVILGNMMKIGSKLKYKCKDSDKSLIITCQENGSWTGGDLYCNCDPPEIIAHGRVTSHDRLNETHLVANVTCDAGYDLRQVGDVFCTNMIKKWTVENVCCDKTVDSEWIKVYSYPKQTSRYIYEYYATVNVSGNGENDSLERGTYCQFRNASVLMSWGSLNISQVRFDVKEGDTVVAFLLFNGTGSSDRDKWFDSSRLLNSSWNDLNASSTYSNFSIKGGTLPNDKLAKFAIIKTFNASCDNFWGWLAVTYEKSNYPCNCTLGGSYRQIMYAKYNNISRFVNEEVGLADRFEIWVKLKP